MELSGGPNSQEILGKKGGIITRIQRTRVGLVRACRVGESVEIDVKEWYKKNGRGGDDEKTGCKGYRGVEMEILAGKIR